MLTYHEVTQEAGRHFLLRGVRGEIVMLNLLRFRELADYSGFPELAPEQPISGSEAYQRYMEHTRPFLSEAGGSVDFMGSGDQWLIGPPGESWDLAILVRHRSVDAFMAFASNDAFLAGMGHRTAAVHDSRLLPLIEK